MQFARDGYESSGAVVELPGTGPAMSKGTTLATCNVTAAGKMSLRRAISPMLRDIRSSAALLHPNVYSLFPSHPRQDHRRRPARSIVVRENARGAHEVIAEIGNHEVVSRCLCLELSHLQHRLRSAESLQLIT